MERKTFVVVSDRLGFVGAFWDVAAAQAALCRYAGFPFVYTEWLYAPSKAAEDVVGTAGVATDGAARCTTKPVWILPYTANAVVAMASADKSEVEKAQAALLRFELVPPDDPRFWESEMGAILPAALRRLEEACEVQDAVNAATPSLNAPASGDAQKESDKKTVERFLAFASRREANAAETQKINLLEGVVPRAFSNAALGDN